MFPGAGPTTTEPPAAAADAPRSDDEALLRRFEPVLKFTHGELFFPMPATTYLGATDLLGGSSLHDWKVLVPAGRLDETSLAELGDPPAGELRFLRFVQEPLNPIELARFNARPGRPVFQAAGRLARVGLLARILDAALVASLLVRGKVPGGTAAAASEKYDELRRLDPRISYHGRVIRKGGWIVLQYLFFYAMNDWRSTFEGANDHEADWEQAFVILEALPGGEVDPVWFAAAAHDEEGSDLRRRWDDPRLEKQGEHVVVYPGAGSHATYMERGEYIMRLPLPGERLLHGVLDLVRRTWRDSLGQPDPGDLAEALKRLVSVPFVDYARGDGLTVGPGQEVEWSPILIGDETRWVDGYRGLWGLDTGDRLAGERAPAGPKWTRVGTVRQSWNDPLGFTGLAGLPTPAETRDALVDRVGQLEQDLRGVEAEAETLAAALPKLGVEVRALMEETGVDAYRTRRMAELAEGEAKLAGLRSQSAELRAAIRASHDHLRRFDAGWRGDPRSHLRHAAVPEPPIVRNRRVFAETWAALSVGILVLALAAILWFKLLPVAPTIALLVVGYLAIESFAQRRFEALLLRITVALTFVSTILLAWHFLRELVLLGLGALGLFILLDNAGELARSRQRRGAEEDRQTLEGIETLERLAKTIDRGEDRPAARAAVATQPEPEPSWSSEPEVAWSPEPEREPVADAPASPTWAEPEPGPAPVPAPAPAPAPAPSPFLDEPAPAPPAAWDPLAARRGTPPPPVASVVDPEHLAIPVDHPSRRPEPAADPDGDDTRSVDDPR